jgi:nucleotide-binding universal stress UspA family protein
MRVLVPIDGSKYSEEALKACAKIVGGKDSIKIISVVEPHYPIAAEPFSVSAEFYTKLEEDERRQASELVAKSVESLKEQAQSGVEITSEVLNGVASRAIIEEAEKWKADLIIVGSHGYGFWQRAWLGSVSDGVVHHSPCSVLVVKSGHSLKD